jgi:tetratricopeptide (TPR) repeat protein
MRSTRAIVIVLPALLALVSCSRDPNSAKKHYLESGDKYFAKGRFKEAAIQYQNAVKQDQRFGPAYYKQALAYLKLTPQPNLPGALKSLRRAVELLKSNNAYQDEYRDSLVKLSDIYLDHLRDKQTLEEVDGYIAVLLKDPNSFDGHRLKGKLYFIRATNALQVANKEEMTRLVDAALQEYRTAQNLKPSDQEVTFKLGLALAAEEKYTEAAEQFQKAINLDKTKADPYIKLYQLYMMQQKPAEGEQVLKQAIQNNPKEFTYLTMLALHYGRQGRRDDMVAVLQQIKSHANEWEEAYKRVGDFYLVLGDGDSALKEYREGMAKDTKHKVEYQKRIIEVLMRQGKRADAAEINSQILKANPNDNDARGLAATLLLDRGDISKALAELQAVVTRAPDNMVAHYNLGRAFVARGEWAQAKTQFQKAIEIKPDYILARITLAQMEIGRGEYEAALKGAQEIIEKYDRNNLNAHLLEAAALAGEKKYSDSKALLANMVKAAPGSPEVHFQMGMVALEEHRYQDASEAFKKSYELNPANSRGLMGMVETDMAQNKMDAALQLLIAESKKSPNRMDIKLGLGNVAVRAGRYEEAVGYYNQVLDSMDKNASSRGEIYLRIGETYRLKGDDNNAIVALQKARVSLPDSEVVLNALALTLDHAGRRNEARTVYEAIIRMDPNNAVALNNLAYLMVETGLDNDVALAYAQRAKQLLPNMSEVSDTLGWIYLKKAQYDFAVNAFQELVAKAPGHSTYHFHLAMAFKMKGDKGKAITQLHEALKFNPPAEERQKIDEMMNQLGGATASR